jgi:hypothetical protein
MPNKTNCFSSFFEVTSLISIDIGVFCGCKDTKKAIKQTGHSDKE